MAPYIHDAETRQFGRMLHYAGILITVVGGVLVYSLLYSPMVDATVDYRNKIELVKYELKYVPEIREQHTKLAERLSDFNQRITKLRQRVPAEAGEWEFLAQITEMAEQEGIRNPLTDMGRSDEGRDARYSHITMSLRGLGRYESLCRLLDRIRRLPRLSKVVELGLKTEFDGQEEYPIDLTLLIYFDLNVDVPDDDEEVTDA